MCDLYVATGGSDADTGTLAQPFRTIQKGVDAARSGDVVCVRHGTYHEQVVIDDPITLQSYPGETATIDGQRTIPREWDYLLKLNGNGIVVADLEVTGAGVNVTGVGLMGDHNEVRNLNVHHNGETGIYAAGDYNLIADCAVWWNADDNEYGATSPWGGGLALGYGTSHNIARGNTVYNNWGEGIVSMRRTEYAVIEQNVVYDNWSVNVYGNGSHLTIQRNLVYSTDDARFFRNGRPATGIAMCDETEYVSRYKTVVNNLVLGGNRAFYYFVQQDSGLKDALIAHNTFVDSDRGTTFQIEAGDHENVRVENNILVQGGSLPIAVVPDDSALSFSHNLWSKSPPASASGSGDVIGDPTLVWGSGTPVPEWFWLQAGSPAIDAGLVLPEVAADFAGALRPQGAGYDMGAWEQ